MPGIFLWGERVSIRQVGGAGTRVTLERWDLPSEPPTIDYGGQQRATAQYYPGNAVPTVQVLGPEEGPVLCSGVFRDRLWLDLGRARRQRDALDQIRRDGYFVELMHGDRSYTALLKRAHFKERHAREISFELEFLIVQPAGVRAGAIAGSAILRFPGVLLGAVSDALGALADLVIGPPLELAASVAGAVAERFAPFSSAVTDALLQGGLLVSTVGVDSALVNRAAGSFSQVRDAANALTSYLDSVPFSPTSIDEAVGEIRITNWIKDVRAGVADLAERGRAAADALGAASGVSWQAVYQARDGDTLQRVALAFYGSKDAWRRIADANGLTDLKLAAGQFLGIPA